MRKHFYVPLILAVSSLTITANSFTTNAVSTSKNVSRRATSHKPSPFFNGTSTMIGHTSQQETSGCKQRQLDLSGNYEGLLFVDKNQKQGDPVTLNVTGNTFQVTSKSFTGKGFVSASRICEDTPIALKFTEVSENFDSFLGTTVSLDAKVLGYMGRRRTDLDEIASRNAVVLSTVRDANGNFAGPDIGFLICPPYPRCLRYPKCPCQKPN